MRALIVHSGNIAGGVERVLASMVALTRERGVIELEVALAFDGPVADTIRRAGALLHVIGPARASRPLSVLRAQRRLRAVIEDRTPAVAITQSTWSLGLFGGTIRAAGVPLVHWVHDTLGTGHWLERLARRQTPRLLVCNSHYSATCASTVFPGAPHRVLYAPLDEVPSLSAAARDEIRARCGASPSTVVIALVGRAEPLKGHTVLVEALGRLADDTRWSCWVVGAPQSDAERRYWASVQTLAVERGVRDRIAFLGARTDVMSLLNAADVYCQPNSGPEAFGLTLLEAMAAGRPVVTSALGAAPEVLAGTRNRLVAAGDAHGVATALRTLIADAGLRRALSQEGRERARVLGDRDAAHQTLLEAIEQVAAARV